MSGQDDVTLISYLERRKGNWLKVSDRHPLYAQNAPKALRGSSCRKPAFLFPVTDRHIAEQLYLWEERGDLEDLRKQGMDVISMFKVRVDGRDDIFVSYDDASARRHLPFVEPREARLWTTSETLQKLGVNPESVKEAPWVSFGENRSR